MLPILSHFQAKPLQQTRIAGKSTVETTLDLGHTTAVATPGLFDNPNITQITADAYEWVETYPDHTFSIILYDPPTFSLAGDLYSADFYQQLHRLLKPKGRLFHYIGDPKSKFGANTAKGVVRRLQDAGLGCMCLNQKHLV